MTQKYQVKVSMKQAAIVETGIVLKQGDFGMQLEIEVLDFDATGTTPQIVFRKAMGAVESTTITVSGNKYTYTFKGTELDTPGKCFCDLKLKNSTTQRISTASFMFRVVADTMDGLAEESSSYSDTIEQIAAAWNEQFEAFAGTVNAEIDAYSGKFNTVDNQIQDDNMMTQYLLSNKYIHYEGNIYIYTPKNSRYQSKIFEYTDLLPDHSYMIRYENVENTIESVCGAVQYFDANNTQIGSNIYLYVSQPGTYLAIPSNCAKTVLTVYGSISNRVPENQLTIVHNLRIFEGTVDWMHISNKGNKEIKELIIGSDLVPASINGSGKLIPWDNTQSNIRFSTKDYYKADSLFMMDSLGYLNINVFLYSQPNEQSFLNFSTFTRNASDIQMTIPDGCWFRIGITTSTPPGGESIVEAGCGIAAIGYKEKTNNVWDAEINASIIEVQEAMEGDCIAFIWLSDNHIDPQSENIMKVHRSTYNNIKALCKALPIDSIIHTGDYVQQAYYTRNESNSYVFKALVSVMTNLGNMGVPYYPVVGNHDGKQANNSDRDVWYNLCYGKWPTQYKNAHFDGTSAYYYIDYPELEMRLIFLAIPDDNYWGPKGEQMHWLVEKALNTPDNYEVMIFYHMPDLMHTGIYSSGALTGAISGYHNHTAGAAGLHTGGTLTWDFTRYTGTKAVCVFCGHTHGDWAFAPGGETSDEKVNNYPCPEIGIGSAGYISTSGGQSWPEGMPDAIAPVREIGKVSEDLFDIVVYSKTNKTLKLIRFGAGQNRTINLPQLQ